jgi:hypothetical protein
VGKIATRCDRVCADRAGDFAHAGTAWALRLHNVHGAMDARAQCPSYAVPKFPENREFNREFSEISPIPGRFGHFEVNLRSNFSALQANSLSMGEQGIFSTEQRIHAPNREFPLRRSFHGADVPQTR